MIEEAVRAIFSPVGPEAVREYGFMTCVVGKGGAIKKGAAPQSLEVAKCTLNRAEVEVCIANPSSTALFIEVVTFNTTGVAAGMSSYRGA